MHVCNDSTSGHVDDAAPAVVHVPRGVRPAILVPVDTTQILLLAVPVVIIELALIIFALRDLLQPERRVTGDSKLMWGVIVVIFGIIGPVLYFLVGREVE